MNNFKEGDKVRIKKDIQYSGLIMFPMKKYAGKRGVIEEEEFGDYRVTVSGALWWPESAIEKLEPCWIIQKIASIFTGKKENQNG